MNATQILNAARKGMDAINRTPRQAIALSKHIKTGKLVIEHEGGRVHMACISDETYGKVVTVALHGQDKLWQFIANNQDANWDAQTEMKEALEYCKSKEIA